MRRTVLILLLLVTPMALLPRHFGYCGGCATPTSANDPGLPDCCRLETPVADSCCSSAITPDDLAPHARLAAREIPVCPGRVVIERDEVLLAPASETPAVLVDALAAPAPVAAVVVSAAAPRPAAPIGHERFERHRSAALLPLRI